ncbi:hypothetical protein PC111_g1596 [Phytophthora cactorum]|nr:hypothetical protein PC112_g2116 [Phytophthora cactorum]KAG2845323.1 hypothetical protein PC111_g1596 [Phytophthora cactorum]KAG3185322.1 hypothetical protein C6341_g4516 [Phytophthora cactorum]
MSAKFDDSTASTEALDSDEQRVTRNRSRRLKNCHIKNQYLKLLKGTALAVWCCALRRARMALRRQFGSD